MGTRLSLKHLAQFDYTGNTVAAAAVEGSAIAEVAKGPPGRRCFALRLSRMLLPISNASRVLPGAC